MTKIKNQEKWDLDKIYPSFHVWNQEYDYLKERIDKYKIYKNNVKDKLFESLTELIDLERIISKLYVYAKMNYDLDSLNEGNNELLNKINNLLDLFSSQTNFFELEVLKITDKDLNELYSKDSQLNEYEYLIEKIRAEKKHFLSEKEENILSLSSSIRDTNSKVFAKLNDTDCYFGMINNQELTHGNYSNFIRHHDQNIRKKAFTLYHEYYQKRQNALSECLISEVKNNIFIANIRKYKDPLAMYLNADKVDPKIYTNLIKNVKKNIPLFNEYLNLKKDELGLKKLHMYDLYTPLNPSSTKEYTYEEAKYLVLESLKVMGDEYYNIAKGGLNDHWVDVYPSKGKTSGAYSFGHYETKPYILMNFNKTLNSVETLAHELGHSMHSYYSREYNPYHYSDYSIFVAEIASNTHELLLFDYLLKTSQDKNMKKTIIETILESFKGSIFRQTQFAEFEKELHDKEFNGEVLTNNKLLNIYAKINEDYYGKVVVQDELIKYEALRIPHFYSSFYVYKYALGLAVAYVFASRIINKEDKAVENYLNFLKSGSKKYPLEVLKDAGIDLVNQDIISEALVLFKNYIEEYKKLI